MIPVIIESLMLGIMPSPSVVTLRPQGSSESIESLASLDDDESLLDRVLPIWVGPTEAAALAASLEEKKSERPLSHELMYSLLRATGAAVGRVVIDRVDGTVFYATVYLHCANGLFSRVDARPSDAITLAVQAGAPLFVEEEVFEAASYPKSFRPGSEKRIEMEEFHKFIENINPEDFAKKSANGE